jgi:hypothetical protein
MNLKLNLKPTVRPTLWTAIATVMILSVAVFAADSTEKVELKLTKDQQAAAALIRKSGGMVLRVANNTTELDVAFHLSDKKGTDAVLGIVKTLPNVTKLNLAGTDITDAGLASVASLKDLTHLHLERTAITDKGIAQLKGLAKLQYINLYATQVTDKSIDTLKGLKNLKKVYLWQSKATKNGATALKKAIPGIYVNTGWEGKPIVAVAKPPVATKLTMKVIMTKGHKGTTSLLAKAVGGKASKQDKALLLSYYQALAKLKPKKGDAKSWKAKTTALISAATKLTKNDKTAVAALKKASDCKACHSVHK